MRPLEQTEASNLLMSLRICPQWRCTFSEETGGFISQNIPSKMEVAPQWGNGAKTISKHGKLTIFIWHSIPLCCLNQTFMILNYCQSLWTVANTLCFSLHSGVNDKKMSNKKRVEQYYVHYCKNQLCSFSRPGFPGYNVVCQTNVLMSLFVFIIFS